MRRLVFFDFSLIHSFSLFFFFNDTATTEIYTLSLHDALPISWYDNSNAVRLGYRPLDDSEEYAAETLAREKPSGDVIAETYQGGTFCTAEEVPNPAAPQKKAKTKK